MRESRLLKKLLTLFMCECFVKKNNLCCKFFYFSKIFFRYHTSVLWQFCVVRNVEFALGIKNINFGFYPYIDVCYHCILGKYWVNSAINLSSLWTWAHACWDFKLSNMFVSRFYGRRPSLGMLPSVDEIEKKSPPPNFLKFHFRWCIQSEDWNLLRAIESGQAQIFVLNVTYTFISSCL